MTHQQLTEFYDYTGLAFSAEPDDVRLLKKQLLLELKAAGNDTLTIASHTYAKNDLIELFDKAIGQPSLSWDPEAFLVRFPLMRKILNPESIFLPVDLPTGLKAHPDLDFFKTQEVQPRFDRYFREVQKSLKENELRTVAAQMIFLELFSDEQQYKVQSSVKIMLRNKFELIKKSLQRSGKQSAIPEEQYFMDPHYYSIIKKVAGDDLEFLVHQLHAAEKKIGKERDLFTSKTIYGFQYDLAFPEEIRVQIKANLDRFKKREGASGGSVSHSGDNKSAGRIVWIVIVVLIFILRVVMKLNRNNNDNNTFDPSMYRDFQQFEQPYATPDTNAFPSVEPLPDPATLEEQLYEQKPAGKPQRPPLADTLSDSI
jgi:hypothetical protein